MDSAAQYRHLVQLGRSAFLATAAPAALVRFRAVVPAAAANGASITVTGTVNTDDDSEDPTLPHGIEPGDVGDAITDLEVYPLIKKPGASFADRITIGRTNNNDIVLVDHSVSRFHAYVRRVGHDWMIADAGSKNGSWLRGESLVARRECPLASRTQLRFGDFELAFYIAPDLFGALGGT